MHAGVRGGPRRPQSGGIFAALSLALLCGCQSARPVERTLTPAERELNAQSFDLVWTTVRDGHFDPSLNGVNWNAARDELRPKVEQAATMSAARAAINDLLDRLHQSHFGIIPKEARMAADAESGGESAPVEGDPGFDIRLLDDQAVVVEVYPGTPAQAAGIRTGWVLRRAGERDADKIISAMRAAYGSQGLADLRILRTLLRPLQGTPGQRVAVVFKDARDRAVSVDLELTTPRGKLSVLGNLPPFPVFVEQRSLPGNVGYLRVSAFFNPDHVMPLAAKAVREFADASGVIVDLRGNPGGIGGMAMGLAGFFVREPNQKLGVMTMRSGPLNFVVNPRFPHYGGPLAVLVDRESASTSEIFAGGMRDLGRARVFGTRTAGAALPSRIDALPNGDALQFAFADYVSAGGKRLEGEGVVPDETVPLTRAALLEGRDPVMEAARAWIERQRSN